MKYYIICFKCNKMLARNVNKDEKQVCLSNHSEQCTGDYLGSLEIIGVPENPEEFTKYMTGNASRYTVVCLECNHTLAKNVSEEESDYRLLEHSKICDGSEKGMVKVRKMADINEKHCNMTPKSIPSEMIPDSNDPWKNRSAKMKCNTCMWFVEKESDNKDKESKIELFSGNVIGRCRRHAPTINGYPVEFENGWCGDHRLDENANYE